MSSLKEEKKLPTDLRPRTIWAVNRFWMEMNNRKHRRYGGKSRHHWYFFKIMLKGLELFLRLTGLYQLGVKNAEDIQITEISLQFDKLPDSFDGFSILHLSDLHFGNVKNMEDKIIELSAGHPIDLVVFTGDYRSDVHGAMKASLESLKHLTNILKPKHGFIGILGNHDGCHMVQPMEDLGIQVLINEEVKISKGGGQIQIIGVDDVHYYFTDQAIHALERTWDGFTIDLVHSPELYDTAAELGGDLYLCGHTHAGQICLPGGYAPIRHLNRGRRFYRKHWQFKNMQGITHAGVGTSGLPVRFNTRGEVLLIELNCTQDGAEQKPRRN